MNKYNILYKDITYNNVLIVENQKQLEQYLLNDNLFEKVIKFKQKILNFEEHHWYGDIAGIGDLCDMKTKTFEEFKLCVLGLIAKRNADMKERLNKGYILVIQKNGSYFSCKKEEIKIIENSKLSEKDIKITRWKNGKHWYAKVGMHDVIDEKGNVKWNSFDEAYKEAKKFLNNINKQSIK